MDDAWPIVFLLAGVPRVGVGVAGLVLCWRYRHARPRACGLFAAGVRLLLASDLLSTLLFFVPGLYETLAGTAGWEVLNIGQTVVFNLAGTAAAVLITLAVFRGEAVVDGSAGGFDGPADLFPVDTTPASPRAEQRVEGAVGRVPPAHAKPRPDAAAEPAAGRA